MTRTAFISCFALSSLLSTTAFADDGEPEAPTVIYAQETDIIFDGLDVTGELVRPVGAQVMARRRAEFAPMMQLRRDFNAEVLASVDHTR